MSEKSNNIKTLTLTSKMNVPISLGTLEYIAGIDPKETWKLVTDEGVETDEFEDIRNKHHDLVGEKAQTKRISGEAERTC